MITRRKYKAYALSHWSRQEFFKTPKSEQQKQKQKNNSDYIKLKSFCTQRKLSTE